MKNFLNAIFITLFIVVLLSGCRTAHSVMHEETAVISETTAVSLLSESEASVREIITETDTIIESVTSQKSDKPVSSVSEFSLENDIETGDTDITEQNTDEWDTSEFLIIHDYRNWSTIFQYSATVISLDGTVKNLDFVELTDISDKRRGRDIDWEECEEIILNCMNDEAYPENGKINPIPEDIINSLKTLGTPVLDNEERVAADAGQHSTYAAVGTEDGRKLIKIGEYGDSVYKSSDEKVNELYHRICEYDGFESGW